MNKIHSTTQSFTEIQDIMEGMAFMKDGTIVSVVEVSSINFFLLSQEEQAARVAGYMSLLNSLTFPIQIFIASKRVDIAFYLKFLDKKIASAKNPSILKHLQQYRDFVQKLTGGERILDKRIYMVLPFSYLELGAQASLKAAGVGEITKEILEKAKRTIVTKQNTMIGQLQRLGLNARALTTQELIKLYYEVFNQDPLNTEYEEGDVKNIIL